MRPLRLVIEGFGSYREHTDVDLSDVDFFVLTGPTGSGKSTVIDALCFALYGTVPRWGKGNMIKNALAPSTTEGMVCLVFEAAGRRFVATRRLKRDARQQVHTKEARLDRLDDAVPVTADLAKLLEASVEQRAEGPDGVTAAVTALLGIGYEHFTQCVLLPQGRFAEFLHAKPGDRQDLLIQLLAFSVYEEVGQRARERGKLAAARLTLAEQRLAELGSVTDEQLAAAARRVDDLAALVPQVDDAVARLAELRSQWSDAARRSAAVRQQLAELADAHQPPGVAELAARLAAADQLVHRRTADRDRLDAAEAAAEAACGDLPERSVLLGWRDAHARATTLRTEAEARITARAAADAAEAAAASAAADAADALAAAEAALAAAVTADRAAALAVELRVGAPCPVCRQPVGAVPHHDVPALAQARAAVDTARSAAAEAQRRLVSAGKAAAAARSDVEAVDRQLAEVQARIADAPPAPDVGTQLAARSAADTAVDQARSAARAGRAALDDAVRDRSSLQAAERRAWSELRAGRERFVALAMTAPPVDGLDLAAAWRTLLDWAAATRADLAAQADALDATEADLRGRGTAAAAALTVLLAEHDVDLDAGDAARAPVALAAHRERAKAELADLRKRRDQASAITDEIARHREQAQVADLLGKLLRSDGFERWLCAEALDSLVTEASDTLLQLSGGQYELTRSGRNELVVIDHNDAATQRPVNTLSGGETFQASLALALALSHQVVGLSGGRRDLNSMFLDEGFGTLDESTLDVVASTLERLADETDRMIGIVTHVPALAERVPVQFAVTRDGASSRLSRVPL